MSRSTKSAEHSIGRKEYEKKIKSPQAKRVFYYFPKSLWYTGRNFASGRHIVARSHVPMHISKKLLFFFFLFAVAFSGASIVEAQNTGFQYTLLEKVPGTDNVGSDLGSYLKALYNVALILVTLSAVLMISIGGFMYLTSAGNTSQASNAKGIIQDALIGLVIALLAYLILYVINPDLANPTLPTLNSATSTGTNLGVSGPNTQPPAASTGTPGTCGGLTPQSGIKCEDASAALAGILSCMKGKGITAAVSSIGDSQGFATCKAKTCACPAGKASCSCAPCAHVQTSCHYGGGASKTASECQKSHAADISIRNQSGNYDQSIANAVMAAAGSCGAKYKDETNIKGVAPHIHVSAPNSCCSL